MERASRANAASRPGALAAAATAFFLAAALALGGAWPLGAPTGIAPAWADEVADAQAALDEAEARMQGIADEYEALRAEADALQERIDETAALALEAQDAVLEGREALGKSARYEYKGGSVSVLLSLVLESSDFGDLLRNVSYLNDIMQYQSDEVAAQKERTERFDNLVSTLNVQKSDQEAKLRELEQKRAEAEQVVAAARMQLENAQAEEAARLAALEAAAQSMAGGTSGGTEGWLTGIASAYGGSTDKYTPNPGTTATGDVCDDWSMGVAVPMSMPNYWTYYGRTVEISYNGMTVFAVVNDCGYMGGGSRVLDLQPGVWKAFGFSSCNGWGLRTVSYRFL